MAYVSSNYATNASAPLNEWVCSPTVSFGPFKSLPSEEQQKSPNYCGQCVSYVKKVCLALPATSKWKKGVPIKGNTTIVAGTVIATFNKDGKYVGHAAIYVSQDDEGIQVYDQYVTPPNPKAISQRLLRWNASGNSNNGNNFYVVE